MPVSLWRWHSFVPGYATRENIAFYDHLWNKFLSYTAFNKYPLYPHSFKMLPFCKAKKKWEDSLSVCWYVCIRILSMFHVFQKWALRGQYTCAKCFVDRNLRLHLQFLFLERRGKRFWRSPYRRLLGSWCLEPFWPCLGIYGDSGSVPRRTRPSSPPRWWAWTTLRYIHIEFCGAVDLI